MPTFILRIEWALSVEYIPFDPDPPPVKDTMVSSVEYWNKERVQVEYQSKCSSYCVHDQIHTLQLDYKATNNLDIEDKDISWGISEISIDLAKRQAKAIWTDDKGSGFDGYSSKCTVHEQLLVEEPVYETVQRISRLKQNILRQQLLEKDGKCAISGETLRNVLDAAHITDAHDSGAYSLANGFLLRTDLHRLFDQGLLNISLDGKVCLNEEVSDYYKKFEEIDANILTRIAETLKKRKSRRESLK